MEDITVAELKERISNKETLNIIDVREPNEFEAFNIGAKLIPMSELTDRLKDFEPYKEEELILHCRSGARSGKVKLFLEGLGYDKVRNLLGGMLKWQETEEA